MHTHISASYLSYQQLASHDAALLSAPVMANHNCTPRSSPTPRRRYHVFPSEVWCGETTKLAAKAATAPKTRR
jgi:hypothetical protein